MVNAAFQTTRWTLVARATGVDSSERDSALAELLSQNWYPLYSFLRRSGKRAEEVEDLIQGFFLRILEKDMFASVGPHRKGRFRNFLLTCLKNYVANQWQHDQAIKRGGKSQRLSLDFEQASQRYCLEPSHDLTPQRAFDRAWAIELVERSLSEIKLRWEEAGKGQKFERLKSCLLGNDDIPRDDVAKSLGISKEALNVAVHRLRAEFRGTLCRQVADTLDRDDLLEDEINFLFSSLSL